LHHKREKLESSAVLSGETGKLKSLKSLVPEAGLEPAQRLAPPDFEYLKPSKLNFFNILKILSILYVLNELGHTYFQIQADTNKCILKPTVTIRLQNEGVR
jgi:hypothetical protein